MGLGRDLNLCGVKHEANKGLVKGGAVLHDFVVDTIQRFDLLLPFATNLKCSLRLLVILLPSLATGSPNLLFTAF